MKRILLLGALVAPLALVGCGTYVGVDDGYGPGGYYAGSPGYYNDVYGDVAVYGYDRGNYHSHYHHYDGGYHHSDVASRGVSHSSHVANVSHASSSHVGGGGGSVSHASASSGGGGHSGGGGNSGGGHGGGGGGHH